MKQILIPCIVVSFLCETIKYIFKNNKLNCILDTVTGIFVLALFISVITQNFHQNYDLFQITKNDFSNAYDSTINEIAEYTEEGVKEKLSAEINKNFGVKPYECIITVNKENLTVEKAMLYFYKTEWLISNFDIKNFIKQRFEIDAEVIFV